MKQTDHVSGHIFLEKYKRQLRHFSAYSYEHFLEHGKGVVIVDENGEGRPKYRYTTVSQTDDYVVEFKDYDPDQQVYFVWKRPGYPDECFIYQDPKLDVRPKQIHEIRLRIRLLKEKLR